MLYMFLLLILHSIKKSQNIHGNKKWNSNKTQQISSDIHDMKVHSFAEPTFCRYIYFLEFSCHIMYTVVCMIISHSNLHKIIIKSIKDIKWSSRSVFFFILFVHFPKSISVTITFLFLLFNYSLVIFPLTFQLLLFTHYLKTVFSIYICECVRLCAHDFNDSIIGAFKDGFLLVRCALFWTVGVAEWKRAKKNSGVVQWGTFFYFFSLNLFSIQEFQYIFCNLLPSPLAFLSASTSLLN